MDGDHVGAAITYVDSNNQINVDLPQGGILDTAGNYNLLTDSIDTPASTCYTVLTLAWTATDGTLHVGQPSLKGDGSFTGDIGDISLSHNATVDGAPAITTCQGIPYVGWVGTDGSHHLNIMEDPGGLNGQPERVITFTDYTRQGAGLSLACVNNRLYIAWLASSGTPHFYLGYYQPLSGNNQLQNAGPIDNINDSDHAPAISPSNLANTLEIIWKGYTNTNIYNAFYSPGSTLNGVQNPETTLFTPAVDYEATAYTGTDNTIYYDSGLFF